MKKKLLIGITSHGFGHFAMTAPIINQLLKENNFEIILRTQVPRFLIESRLQQPVEVIEEASDFGMKMNSSLDVDVEASQQLYIDVHSNWENVIQHEASRLQQIRPDLILSNIPYTTLAAAERIGIPALAYCSLNWAEITADYFEESPEFIKKIIPQMLQSYNLAQQFICPAPAMAMPALHNVVNIGPVCTLGQNIKNQILNQLKLSAASKLVLITAGGVATHIPIEQWPKLNNVVWLCGWSGESERSDIVYLNQLNIPFRDLMASCDLVVTKPGYGIVSESVCHGKPALFVRRSDWAEEVFLLDWWQKHGLASEISREQFFSGNLAEAIERVFASPAFTPLAPVGILEATEIINSYL